MADGNYEPPRAPLQENEGPRKRPNLLAIVIGALVDFFSTLLSSLLLGIGYAVYAGASGVAMDQMAAEMAASSVYIGISSLVGLGCSVLGGYVCARYANQNEYANGLAVGIIGVFTGELMGPAEADIWMHVLALATIPACVLGAHIKMRRDKA
jgi:hypothetical protein